MEKEQIIERIEELKNRKIGKSPMTKHKINFAISELMAVIE